MSAAAQRHATIAEVAAAARRPPASRIVVRGTVTRFRPGRSLYITDATGSLFVNTAQRDPVSPGDVVEVVGVPALDEFAPFVEAERYTRIGSGPAPPRPLEVTAHALLSGGYEAHLVRLEAEIVAARPGTNDDGLWLRAGGVEFGAFVLKERHDGLMRLAPGTVVQVTGVCSVKVAPNGVPAGFELLLRDGADLSVVRVPSWWTRERIAGLLASCAAVLLVVGAWALTLRRRVRRQTAALRTQLTAADALKERYAALVENASDVIYTHDLDGRITSINRAGERMVGYTRDQGALLTFYDLLPPDEVQRVRELIDASATQRASASFRTRLLTRGGHELPVEIRAHVVLVEGQPAYVQGIARDLTERERVERELRDAQRIESVGRLSAAIAHDFSNLLTVICAYGDLVASRVEPDPELRDAMREIRGAAARASSLTAQMLAFGRRQFLAPAVVDLNEIVRSMAPLIDRACGDEVELVTITADRPLPVLIDRVQMEQTLVNLSVNAREAMPGGGRLSMSTAHWRIADASAAASLDHGALPIGDYGRLVVTDTGLGMSAEVKQHIFEPFFSTKETGSAGLGLSTVHGFVKQSGGHIALQSAPGAGTTVELLFPLHRGSGAEAPGLSEPQTTILLVEDDPPVRRLILDALSRNGYTVLEGADGEQARDLARRHEGPIHLLLTDLKMPRLGGIELARWLGFQRPGVRVLFMSGYAAPPAIADGMFGPGSFLQKPFTRDVLLARLRHLLGSRLTT